MTFGVTNDQRIIQDLTNSLARCRSAWNFDCAWNFDLCSRDNSQPPSPSTIRWACIQLLAYANRIGMIYLSVDTELLVTDEIVGDLAEFIRISPSLSQIYFQGDERGKADVLLQAAVENEGIKEVTLRGSGYWTPEAVSALIALLTAGHVEKLTLFTDYSFSITKNQNETLIDALLMNDMLSYVQFNGGPFASRVLEKLSQGGKTGMKSLVVSIKIEVDQYSQMTIDSFINCIKSPRANIQTLRMKEDYFRSPAAAVNGIKLTDMRFRKKPDNRAPETTFHLDCQIAGRSAGDLLGFDIRDDKWLDTVMSVPTLEHFHLYHPNDLSDTDIDSLSSALSLRSIGFYFKGDLDEDPSVLYPTIGYLSARGSLKDVTMDNLAFNKQGWANFCEFIIASAPSLDEFTFRVSLEDSTADGFPATTAQMPHVPKDSSWNIMETLLAEFLWSLSKLAEQDRTPSCSILFSDDGSVRAIICKSGYFDLQIWHCLCRMLADSTCAIESVRIDVIDCHDFDTTLHPGTGKLLWVDMLFNALDANLSVKDFYLDDDLELVDVDEVYVVDTIEYYTTRNKLNDLLSRDETTTTKLWVPAVEAVRDMYHGKSQIFHLAQAKPWLFH